MSQHEVPLDPASEGLLIASGLPQVLKHHEQQLRSLRLAQRIFLGSQQPFTGGRHPRDGGRGGA